LLSSDAASVFSAGADAAAGACAGAAC